MTGCVSRRGHDHVARQHFCPLPNSDWCIDVLGCVLHMRGQLTPQPVCNEGGDWLLWNGEVFHSSVFEVTWIQYNTVCVQCYCHYYNRLGTLLTMGLHCSSACPRDLKLFQIVSEYLEAFKALGQWYIIRLFDIVLQYSIHWYWLITGQSSAMFVVR